MQPLQLQQEQNAVAQQNQAIQSQKALQQAYIDGNGDWKTAAPLAIKNGARVQDIQAAVNADMEHRQKLATLTKTQQEVAQNQAAAIGQESESLLQIKDPAQRQQAWVSQTLPSLQKQGIDVSQFPQQVPDDMTLQHHGVAAMKVNEQLDEVRKDAEFKDNFGALDPDKIDQINQGFSARWKTLNPTTPVPQWARLGGNATPQDFSRVDKILQQTEQAQGTQAQRQTANAIRMQTYQLAQQAAQERAQAAQDRQDAAQTKWVTWNDPNTGKTVAGPMSAARAAGAKEMAQVPTNEITQIQDARGVVQLITKQGDPKGDPSTWGVNQLIDSLNKDGKMGVVTSRLNSFLAGGIGAEPGDDPRIMALMNKSDLAMTLSMKAHFGASGGRSPIMLNHFLSMANAKTMNANTLKAGFGAVENYMEDRGMMQPQSGGTQSMAPSKIPAGATMKVPGSDGQMHWSDGKQDLGVVK
jgi:hypothetical protein